VSERIEYKFISHTNFFTLLNHRISMTVYHYNLLMVTTHALHLTSLCLISPSSSLTHSSFLYRVAQKVGHHQFKKNRIKDCHRDYISS